MPSIFFPICSVTNMSLGDIETIVSCNQSRVTHWDLSLGKFNSELKYSSDSLYIGFHFQSLTILWYLMKYSQRSLTLKRLFSNFYVFGSTWYLSIYLAEFSQSELSPIDFFDTSPVGILFPGLTLENFWKFFIFPGKASSPHRGTEAGCFTGYFYFETWITWTMKNMRSGKPRPWKSWNEY